MRKYISVWMLYVRSCLGGVLIVLVLEGIVLGISFGAALHRVAADAGAAADYAYVSLQMVLGRTHPGMIAGVSFILVSAVLLGACRERGSRTGYRLRTLQISERAVSVMHMLANLMFYLLFWAVQILLLYACAKVYALQEGIFSTGQTVLLLFYQNPYIRAVLPLADTAVYVRNFAFAVLLAAGAACHTTLRRRTAFVWEMALLLAATLVLFPIPGEAARELEWSVILLVAGVLADIIMLVRLRGEAER